MKKGVELIFKIIIMMLFIIAILLGGLAFANKTRNMVLFFVAMVCVLLGNVLNLVRLILKKKKLDE